MSEIWRVTSADQIPGLVSQIEVALALGAVEIEIVPAANKITVKQRGSIHVWFRECAEIMNDAALDVRTVLAEECAIPWTEHSWKEQVYKVMLNAMQGKASTNDMNTLEPSEVCDVLARHFGQKFGVVLPAYPSNRG